MTNVEITNALFWLLPLIRHSEISFRWQSTGCPILTRVLCALGWGSSFNQSHSSNSHRLTPRCISTRMNAPDTATPNIIRKISRNTKNEIMSPAILTPKSTTANHQAHLRPRNNPNPPAHVAIPIAIRNKAAGPRIDTKTVSPGRFNCHKRYINALGKRREPPTKNAITVAKNRNAATTTTDFGRSGTTPRMPVLLIRHSDIRQFEIRRSMVNSKIVNRQLPYTVSNSSSSSCLLCRSV